jgi:hypothetical protein
MDRGAIGARFALPTLLEPDAPALPKRAFHLTSPASRRRRSRALRRFRGRSSYLPGLMSEARRSQAVPVARPRRAVA